jgi:hypothetical protein
MALSENMQACFGILWICAFGCIVTILMKSPLVFLFAFGLCYSFFAILKGFGDVVATPNSNDNFEVFEMQPLEMGGKAFKDMTLGQMLNKY